MSVAPDILIEVRLRTEAEGGRTTPISGKLGHYSAVMKIEGQCFDCRTWSDQELRLGESYILPVKFLHPEYALPLLRPGKRILLWEGKDIADGAVVCIVAPGEPGNCGES